jgi:hypothetical protein
VSEKKARQYYNEEKMQTLLKEYQKSAVIRDDVVIIKDKKIEEEIIKEITKIVNAIIMVYKFYVFEEYDDLKQHALHACYKNLVKFTPQKGTSFNFFSLISKKCLLNYTTRKKKHRNHADIDDQIDLTVRNEVNYDRFLKEMELALFNIIDENFIGYKRKNYINIASVIMKYLNITYKFISKSDLYSFARSYGIKNTQIRMFVKDISEYNVELFSIIND